MKGILALCSILLFFNNISAQSTNKGELSESDKISLVVKEKHFEEIGKFQKIKLTLITIKTPKQDRIEKFLELRQKLLDNQDKCVIIDLNQINELINSMKCLKENISDVVPENYIEIFCENKSGIETGIYPGGKVNRYWETYLVIDKSESKYRVVFIPEELNEFLSLLEKVKEMMQ